MPDTKPIQLPNALYERAQAAFKDAGFKSVDEYVAFVLEQVLQSTGSKSGPSSSDEDEKVRKRLKALGYME